LVTPGQPLAGRLRGALALPRRVREGSAQGRSAVAGLRAGQDPRLAVFGDRPLDPTGDSASHRLGGLLRLAIADGWLVSFHSCRQRRWFEVAPELCLTPADPPPSIRVAWVVRPEAAAAVMPSLNALRPGVRVVYDSMDLHYLRLERQARVTNSLGLAVQARLMRRLEREVSSSADVAVAISGEEAPLLRALAGTAEVAILPNVHQARGDEPPPRRERSDLLFVGNFTHAPNVDAVDVLVHEVMPRLWRHRPELVLAVAGRGLEARSLDERIRVLGFVDDLDALVDSSAALVAPLRFGAGLKGKLGYALARGLPVVTTAVGAEGFSPSEGMLVVPDGDWDTFAARTLELLGDDELWLRASAAGIDVTRREYSPEAVAPMLRRVLAG
jgi:glycosyltransferase involved in cell wall biosynthesis